MIGPLWLCTCHPGQNDVKDCESRTSMRLSQPFCKTCQLRVSALPQWNKWEESFYPLAFWKVGEQFIRCLRRLQKVIILSIRLEDPHYRVSNIEISSIECTRTHINSRTSHLLLSLAPASHDLICLMTNHCGSFKINSGALSISLFQMLMMNLEIMGHLKLLQERCCLFGDASVLMIHTFKVKDQRNCGDSAWTRTSSSLM